MKQEIWHQPRDKSEDKFRNQVRNQVRDQFWNRVENQFRVEDIYDILTQIHIDIRDRRILK